MTLPTAERQGMVCDYCSAARSASLQSGLSASWMGQRLWGGVEGPQGQCASAACAREIVKGSIYTKGFSTLALLKFWAKWFFVAGGCAAHCTIFGSIAGLYLLDVSSILSPAVTFKMSLNNANYPMGLNCL